MKIKLKKDEQVTFKFLDTCEFDFVNKKWGAYVTPSLFKRCKKFGLKPALIKNIKINSINIIFVRFGKEQTFLSTLNKKKTLFLGWLKLNDFKLK